MTVNLIKLSVGSESVESLAEWQDYRFQQLGKVIHTTRMAPKRRDEILDGGSIYWVIKRYIQARQRIIGLDPVVGDDGINRIEIVLDRELIHVRPLPRRPFQGWRYFDVDDAPPDMTVSAEMADMPDEMRNELMHLGLL